MLPCTAIALLVSAALVKGDTIHVLVVEDTTICESSFSDQRANALGDGLFIGVTGQNVERRSLLQFNLSQIHSPNLIKSVQLQLFERSGGLDIPVVIGAYRVLQSWSEGNSFHPGGQCAPATSDDASWNYSHVGNEILWQQPGGSFKSVPSALQIVQFGETTYTWTGNGLIEDIAFWKNNPSEHFGWIFVSNSTETRSVKSFASKEFENSDVRPRLIVTLNTKGSSDNSRTTILAVSITLIGIIILALCVLLLLRYRQLQQRNRRSLSENEYPM